VSPSVASTSALREAALGVFREATWAAKALRNQAREKAIARLQEEFASLFRRQGRMYAERLPKIANLFLHPAIKEASYDGDLVDAFSDVFSTTRAQAEKSLVGALFDGYTMGYEALAGNYGLETAFKLKPAQATAWARENAATRITKINETTQNDIRDLITRGIDEGKDYGSVAREIRDTFYGFTTSRAEMCAVTENSYAYESGTASLVSEIKDAGIDMEKSWSTVGGDECAMCAGNEDAGWIGTDEAFPSGDQFPPNHPNCRCAALYRVQGVEEE